MREDERFNDKEVFVGVKVGGGRLAVNKDLLRRRGLATAQVADTPLAVVYDAGLDEGRAFLARAGSRELAAGDEAGSVVDKTTGTTWDATGRAREGSLAGARLEQLVSYDVMWFAWVAFFPETEVVA